MWQVTHHSKIEKQIKKLPEKVLRKYVALILEIQELGPYRKNWLNYGKLSNDDFHCHIKKGKPTYVVCWRIIDKKIKITEVYYAGTHEKAPY